MELKTKRLRLVDLSLAYLEDIHHLHSLPEVTRFNTLPVPEELRTTELLISEWIRQQQVFPRTSYMFCMTLLQTSQFIGLIALHSGKPNFKVAEVWYKTLPAFWGKGYTTEALTCLLQFGFGNLHLHRIEAGCAVQNTASVKVLEKTGMIREGIKRKNLPIGSEWLDAYLYAILDSDFNT